MTALATKKRTKTGQPAAELAPDAAPPYRLLLAEYLGCPVAEVELLPTRLLELLERAGDDPLAIVAVLIDEAPMRGPAGITAVNTLVMLARAVEVLRPGSREARHYRLAADDLLEAVEAAGKLGESS